MGVSEVRVCVKKGLARKRVCVKMSEGRSIKMSEKNAEKCQKGGGGSKIGQNLP